MQKILRGLNSRHRIWVFLAVAVRPNGCGKREMLLGVWVDESIYSYQSISCPSFWL